MTNTRLSVVIALLLASGAASAAPASDGAIGVGAEAQINGNGGISVNYNTNQFHVGGFLGLVDPGGNADTTVGFGGRFYFHVHNKSNTADFSIGGSLGIVSVPPMGMGGRSTNMFVEPGFQMRAFIVPNVALSLSAGIVLGLVDTSGVSFAGQLTGGAGFHYYFF